VSSEIELLVERTKLGDRRAAEALLESVQHDLFRMALRMLGTRAEAEDATQEILLQALTHLSEFRAESAFRTWLWRIAIRHLLRAKKSRREQLAGFETLERLLAQGEALASEPAQFAAPTQGTNAERALMAQELRLACTQGVLLSLERDQRIAWILAEIFELSSEEAATVLEIEIPTYRKRLSRARERLETWMRSRCGLVNGANACRCTRQIPIAAAFGVLDIERLEYARYSGPALRVVAEADEIEAVASVLKAFPSDQAPPAVLANIRALIDSGRYRVFDT